MRVDYRATFDRVADLYDEARPGYPPEVVAEICRYAGLTDASRILEVGTGTGQITRPFAELGYRIVGLELGPRLARLATKNLAPYPRVRIENVALEAWTPQDAVFDLFLSAQAFHWIESGFGLATAKRVLKPGGALALVWNLDESSKTAFYRASTPLFDKYIPSYPLRPAPPASYELYEKLIAEDAELSEVTVLKRRWQRDYSRAAFLKLLATFSSHIAAKASTRQQFFAEMGDLIDTFGGSVARHYRTVALLAKTVA